MANYEEYIEKVCRNKGSKIFFDLPLDQFNYIFVINIFLFNNKFEKFEEDLLNKAANKIDVLFNTFIKYNENPKQNNDSNLVSKLNEEPCYFKILHQIYIERENYNEVYTKKIFNLLIDLVKFKAALLMLQYYAFLLNFTEKRKNFSKINFIIILKMCRNTLVTSLQDIEIASPNSKYFHAPEIAIPTNAEKFSSDLRKELFFKINNKIYK